MAEKEVGFVVYGVSPQRVYKQQAARDKRAQEIADAKAAKEKIPRQLTAPEKLAVKPVGPASFSRETAEQLLGLSEKYGWKSLRIVEQGK